MRLSRSILATVAAVALLATGASAASAAPVADEPDSIAVASGEIVDTTGTTVGDLLAIELGPETLWMLSVSDLAPGLHGMQLHEVGDCGDGIAGVGGQIDRADLATLSVGYDGRRGEQAFSTSSDDLAGLADTGRVSLVVHARPTTGRTSRPATRAPEQSTGSEPAERPRATSAQGSRAAMDVRPGCRRSGRSGADEFTAGPRHPPTRRRRRTRAGEPPAPPRRHRAGRHGRHQRRAARSHPPGRRPGIDRPAGRGAAGLPGDVHGVQVHAGGPCTGTAFADAGPKVSDIDLPDVVTAGDGRGCRRLLAVRRRAAVARLAAADDGTTVVVHTDADNHANVPNRYTSAGARQPGGARRHDPGDGRRRRGAAVRHAAHRPADRALHRRCVPGDPRADGRALAAATWTSYLQRHSRATFVATVRDSLEARRLFVRTCTRCTSTASRTRRVSPTGPARLGKPRFDQDSLGQASSLRSASSTRRAGRTATTWRRCSTSCSSGVRPPASGRSGGPTSVARQPHRHGPEPAGHHRAPGHGRDRRVLHAARSRPGAGGDRHLGDVPPPR